MKKTFRNLIIAAMLSVTLTACQSKEEKVISQLEDIAEQLEAKGDAMSEHEWDEALAEFESISKQISNDELQFSDEQQKEVKHLQGKVLGEAAKHTASQIGKGIGDALKQGADVLKGIADGLKGDGDK